VRRHRCRRARRPRRPAFLALLFALPLLAACGTLETETVTLRPIFGGTHEVFERDIAFVCGVDRSGVASVVWDAEDRDTAMIAGYTNVFWPGADPVPCERRHSGALQAKLLFDLAPYEGLLVEEAWLEFDNRRVFHTDGLYHSECVMPLGAAEAVWVPGYDSGQGREAMLPARTAAGGVEGAVAGPQRLRVTGFVRDWVSGSRTNHGFLIGPPEERLWQDETKGCVAGIGDPRLVLTVTRTVRP
jgi:hypothetical protein